MRFILCRSIGVVGAIILIFSFPAAAVGATRIALLVDPKTSAAKIAALLETSLTNEPDVMLVDRSQFDQIIQEQQLQACFAADAVGQRARLGQLLQADVLVMLRSGAESQDRLEIVVCETHHGLRLLIQSAPMSDDPQTDVEAIRQSIRAAIDKSRQTITSIIAVPDFVCNDLSFEFSYLGSAYARLIEQSLLDRQGVLVTEIAEARALEKELELGDRTKIDRPLPFYLFGEYRNNGTGAARRVSIMLSLKQGERELGHAATDRLAPDQAPAFLLQSTGRLLNKSDGWNAPAPDPKAESALLAERAHVHEAIGDLSEALDLIEAGLLVDPTQVQLHGDAIHILYTLRQQMRTGGNIEDFFKKNGDQWIELKRRELEHLEPWFRATRIGLDPAKSSEYQKILDQCSPIYFHGIPDSFKERALELDRRQRQIYFSTLEARLNAGQTEFYEFPMHFDMLLIGTASAQEEQEVVLRAIRLMQDSAHAEQQVASILLMSYGPIRFEDPDFDSLLKEAAKMDNPAIRAAVIFVRGRADRDIAQLHYQLEHQDHRLPALPPLPPGTPTVIFSRIPLFAADATGQPVDPPENIASWLRAGDAADAVFGRDALYLMHEKGKLKRIFKSDEECFRFSKPSFDEKYVWAPVVLKDHPEVLVVDPVGDEIVARFTETDGLPPMAYSAIAAGLDPGRACVSGGFGRGWIASMHLLADGTKAIHVFFEAKLPPDRSRVGDKKDLHTAFSPDYVYTVRGRGPDAKPQIRLLIGRSSTWSFNPLLVDPDAEIVKVFDYPLATGSVEDLANDDGQIFMACRNVSSLTMGSISRIALPDMKPVKICELAAFGPMIFFGGRAHILARQWMTADTPAGPYTPLAGDIPGHQSFRILYHSNFYGLVLTLFNSDTGTFAVEIPTAISDSTRPTPQSLQSTGDH